MLILVVGVCLYMLYRHYEKRMDMHTSTIIILNGPSASGKSSLQEAFIRQQAKPWIKMGIDNSFVGVLSPYYVSGEYQPLQEEYCILQGRGASDSDGNPLFYLEVGEQGKKIIKGMNRAIKAYADAGNDIIVDYIAYESSWIEELYTLLREHKVVVVKVDTPLEILEKREKERATSPQGHARTHYKNVHDHKVAYDMTIDTSIMTPQEGASMISKILEKM